MGKYVLVLLFISISVQAEDSLPNDPETLKSLVSEGNHEAMTKLGYLYFLGNKVEKDQTKD